MSRALLAGLAAGYGIAVPIGAVGTYLVSVSARSGVRRGAFGALGIASADALYASVAVLGGAALASVIEPSARPLQLVSVAVLVGIAVGVAVTTLRARTSASPGAEVVTSPQHHGGRRGRQSASPVRRVLATAGRAAGRTSVVGDVRTYLGFLGMTVLNPMTVVYFTALVLGGHGELFRSVGDRIAFVVAAAVASASWQLLLAGSGAVLGRTLTGPRGRLATGLASSAVILVLAVRLV